MCGFRLRITGRRAGSMGLVLLACLLCAPTCNIDCDDPTVDTQGFAVAFGYRENNAFHTAVRHSTDGQSWSAGFQEPAFQSPYPAALGLDYVPNQRVGVLAGHDHDARTIQLEKEVLGYWLPVGAQPPGNPGQPEVATSGPSVAYVGNNRWLIAYRYERGEQSGDGVALRLLDTGTSPPAYVGGNLFPSAWYDAQTVGNPSVMACGSRVVVQWSRQFSPFNAGYGRVGGSGIEWLGDAAEPDWAQLACLAITSDRVLTHDHERFYMAFVAMMQLTHGYGQALLVLQSTDGASWGPWSHWWLESPYLTGAKVALAARADRSLLAIVMAQDGRLRAAWHPGDAGSTDVWEERDPAAIFQGRWLTQGPVLVATGHPAQEKERLAGRLSRLARLPIRFVARAVDDVR